MLSEIEGVSFSPALLPIHFGSMVVREVEVVYRPIKTSVDVACETLAAGVQFISVGGSLYKHAFLFIGIYHVLNM